MPYRLYCPTTCQAAGREVAPEGGVWYRGNDQSVVTRVAPAADLRPVAPEEFARLEPEVELELKTLPVVPYVSG
jgi:hypothetical protein